MKYSYVGYTDSMSVISGKVIADDEQIAEQILTNRGYRIISVKPVSPFISGTGTLFRRSVNTFELVIFTRQLALLLESGVSIVRSLELLQVQMTDRGFRSAIDEVIIDIRKGNKLSSALERHSHIFSKMYCRMVAVGEQTGGLEAVLKNLAGFIEKQAAAMQKLKSAMIYPAIVIIVAIVVAIIMITFLLPAITELFKALGGELPLQTRIVIWLMDFIKGYGLYLLLAIVCLSIILFSYIRTKKGRYNWDNFALRIPMLGRIIWLNELARLCRSLAILFSSGVPLPEALLLSAQASNNSVLVQNLREVQQEMIMGEGLAGPMKNRPIFMPLMVEMAKVGEETGHLDSTLSTVADSYEIEADRRTQTMLTMVEPAMTIVIGIAVGFLALSIIGPIYSSLGLFGGK